MTHPEPGLPGQPPWAFPPMEGPPVSIRIDALGILKAAGVGDVEALWSIDPNDLEAIEKRANECGQRSIDDPELADAYRQLACDTRYCTTQRVEPHHLMCCSFAWTVPRA